jgi:hypothetical protein
MRMWQYFLGGALLLVVALALTIGLGLTFDATHKHLWAGLFTVALGVGVHTLVILFMLVTGRVLREAVKARRLSDEFLVELNQFFASKRAYPLAGLGAASLVAAGVLGYGSRGFGISPAWHWLIGVGAALLNLFALQHEYIALRANQRLVDRAQRELDASDRAAELSGAVPAAEAPPAPWISLRNGLTLAIGAWLPYLYRTIIERRGRFDDVGVHPWLELSVLGVVVTLVALSRRNAARGAA